MIPVIDMKEQRDNELSIEFIEEYERRWKELPYPTEDEVTFLSDRLPTEKIFADVVGPYLGTFREYKILEGLSNEELAQKLIYEGLDRLVDEIEERAGINFFRDRSKETKAE